MLEWRGQMEVTDEFQDDDSTLTDDPEHYAKCLLYMGLNLEKQNDFRTAASCYSRALLIEPLDKDIWYFIHNNLGYCLVQIGDYRSAEKYCRAAIRINPQRQSGHCVRSVMPQIWLSGQDLMREQSTPFVSVVLSSVFDIIGPTVCMVVFHYTDGQR